CGVSDSAGWKVSSRALVSLPHNNWNVTVNLGSDVNLTCGEKNWSETLYVLWKINLKHRSCDITREQDSPTVDKCNDRKQLLNATGSTSYLRVPHVSLDDVGIYTCESAFNGGNNKHVFNVTVTADIVGPMLAYYVISHRSNKMVAVCRAERGKPAANISWSFDTVSPSVDYHDTSDGFISVVSSLELAEDTNIENLICVITHPKIMLTRYVHSAKRCSQQLRGCCCCLT
uniref:CD200 receptor 1 n=1 Tax=Cynoglossus semilaevis TaxID=244447 RepID=A0A3P8VTZ5_CYNSE